jgi:YVTN family beta-propeller protein
VAGEARAAGGSVRRLDADVLTFLIADVRGFTRFTQEQGDEAASRLARDFAAIVRDALPEFGGELVETRGDEALAVFGSARQALRASVELQRRFRDRSGAEPFPLGVGMGLDAGEAVPTEGGYRGKALNIAARLCAIATPGQILATDSVVHLAHRVDGLTYVSKRAVRLKGLEDPVRLVEVVPETELPPVPAPPRAKRRLRPRRLLLGAALAAALAAALVAVVLARGDDAQPVVVAPNSVAVIDPASNEVVDSIGVGNSPGPIAAGSGSLWVVNLNDRTLTKIDPVARSVTVRSVGLHVGSGLSAPKLVLAAAGDDIWVWACHLSLFRVDPRNAQAQEFEIFRDTGAYTGFSCAMAAESGSVWVPLDYREPGHYRPEVLHVEAPADALASISERFPVPAPEDTYRSAMTIGARSVWLADYDGGVVRRQDPANGTITATMRLGDGPTAMAFGHGSAWVANDVEDSVTRIDPRTNSVVRAISVGSDPVALAIGPDAIWVANSGDGTVSRIDPDTNSVRKTISVGHRPLGVAVANGLVWVTVRS